MRMRTRTQLAPKKMATHTGARMRTRIKKKQRSSLTLVLVQDTPPPAACMASSRWRMSPDPDVPSHTAHPERKHSGRSTPNPPTHQAADGAVQPPLHQPVSRTLRWHGVSPHPCLHKAQGSGSHFSPALAVHAPQKPFLLPSRTHPI